MPANLALLLWIALLVVLIRFDPARNSKVSLAVWIPLIWMFIQGSRLPSQWIGGSVGSAVEAYQDGNPTDRTIFLILIFLAAWVLGRRSFQWRQFFAKNLTLAIFLSFALLSVVWSDFPFVGFKRWFRDLGQYLVILVVLSEAQITEAVATLLRRLSYCLVSLSVLLVKYFPQMGRGYSEWTGAVTYNGCTTSKDLLGTICMVSGIFFIWDTVARFPDRKDRKRKWIFLVNSVFFGMTLWLLNLADCATCKVCLIIGSTVIVAFHIRLIKKHPTPLKILIPIVACLCLFLVFGIDAKAMIGSAVGRNATFTDRTLLWPTLLKMQPNSLLGAGYESFWLGDRLKAIWALWAFRPNQAHNGYLELYLNLGGLGVALMMIFLIATYWAMCKEKLTVPHSLTPFKLALWAMLPVYNITTSDFGKGEIMWITFLMAALTLPEVRWKRMATRLPSVRRRPGADIPNRLREAAPSRNL